MTASTPVLRVAGPVGAGKTTLVSKVVPALRRDAAVGVIYRDPHPTDEKFITEELGGLSNDRTILAMRNSSDGRLERVLQTHDDLDLVVVEDVGTTATLTVEDQVVDYTVYVVSVSEGNNIPFSRETAIKRSDLVVLNKVDLAGAVDANLDQITRDIRSIREGPFYLTDAKHGDSIESVVNRVRQALLEL